MSKILLNKSKWTYSEEMWFSGFILINNEFINAEKAINYIKRSLGLTSLEELLNNLNGRFSMIFETSEQICIATDKSRSTPLFFTNIEDEFNISDSIDTIISLSNCNEPEQIAVDVFLRTGYTINNQTLIKNIFVTEPCEILCIKENKWESKSYLSYPKLFSQQNIKSEEKEAELAEILHQIFSRLFKAIESRPIAIPLSGGYDSRLVAYMAKLYHKNKILAYTYGSKNNCEIENAKRTAEVLGIDWIFIEYNSNTIENFTNDPDFQNYYRFASNYTSSFWLQDYFAVKTIKDKKLVDDDCIFIPGLTGDSIAGVFLQRKYTENASEHIFSKNFYQFESTKEQKAKIISEIEKFKYIKNEEAWQSFYLWFILQRQTKFNANSARVYTFFGYDYHIPFWDNDFLTFYLGLPYELKSFKCLYNKVVESIFQSSGLLFKNELQPSRFQRNFQYLKEEIKRFIPSKITNLLSGNSSPFYYEEITKLLYNEIDKKNYIVPKQKNYYNTFISQWYVQNAFKSLGIK
jgi:asparagine synthase (glutamine-hydrolysing)